MQSSREEVISSLIKDDPVTQELLAETEADGGAWARGRLQSLQDAALSILQVRFPILAATTKAQQAIASIENADTLKMLFQQLLRVPDEQTARIVLGLPSE